MICSYIYFSNADLTRRLWRVGHKYYRQEIPIDGITNDVFYCISKKKFYKLKKYYKGFSATGISEIPEKNTKGKLWKKKKRKLTNKTEP